MNSMDDFLALLRDELGLQVTRQDVGVDLHHVAGWDSLYFLYLLTTLEKRTGRSLLLADLLEASTLNDIYALAVTE